MSFYMKKERKHWNMPTAMSSSQASSIFLCRLNASFTNEILMIVFCDTIVIVEHNVVDYLELLSGLDVRQ